MSLFEFQTRKMVDDALRQIAVLNAAVGITPAPAPAPNPTPTPTLIGFYPNGASNAKLKAALSRVSGGTGRAKGLFIADSVLATGQGTSTEAAPGPYGLVNARKNRPAAVFAASLSAAGIPAIDGSFVGDNGLLLANQTPLPTYDPRVSLGTGTGAWAPTGGLSFAGGNYLVASNTGTELLSYTPEGQVDTFEVVLYNSIATTSSGPLYIDIDGSPPATGMNPIVLSGTGGFARFVYTVPLGSHTFRLLDNDPSHQAALCSITAYNSAAKALDLKVPGSCGSSSSDLAATSATNQIQRWSRLEYYAFEAPDFAVVSAGYNDMNNGVSVTTYTAALQAIIDTVKQTGDPLLVFPSPAGGSYYSNASAFHDAAKSLAASEGIAFLSLYDHYGSTFTPTIQARTFDGIVHQKAEYAAEQAGLIRQAFNRMLSA